MQTIILADTRILDTLHHLQVTKSIFTIRQREWSHETRWCSELTLGESPRHYLTLLAPVAISTKAALHQSHVELEMPDLGRQRSVQT